jgi:hypothetical protein
MADQTKSETFLTPAALQKITADRDHAEAQKAAGLEAKRREEEQALNDAFMHREVQPNAMDRVMAAVKRAAEHGETHITVFQFPSKLCKDQGRAINSADPNWPASLDGFPARAFAFYEEHLQRHGFRLRAEIINFPGGMPGDVAVTLHW